MTAAVRVAREGAKRPTECQVSSTVPPGEDAARSDVRWLVTYHPVHLSARRRWINQPCSVPHVSSCFLLTIGSDSTSLDFMRFGSLLGASMVLGLANCTDESSLNMDALDPDGSVSDSGPPDAGQDWKPWPSDGGRPDTGSGKPTTPGRYRVNESGQITYRGTVLQIFGVNWFGLEGRYGDDGSAPMLLFTGERTVNETFTQLTAARNTLAPAGPGLGQFNTVRIQVAPQTLDDRAAREQLANLVRTADRFGVHVIFDLHSCSNFVGWRADRLDAAPPYVDSGRGPDYPFRRDDYACAAGTGVAHEHPYNQELWLGDLRELASLPAELGVDNVLGIDLFNEPFGYTWAEWKALAEAAAEAIMAVNDDVLVIVQGVGDLSPHGSIDPSWGENLSQVAVDPLAIPRERLVLSAHTYGPSVFVQSHFLNADGQVELDETVLRRGWEDHFGFVKDLNYGFLLGEFGGDITVSEDLAWQQFLVDYLIERGLTNFTYWALNPESSDTGGIFDMSSAPVSGAWLNPIPEKLDLLARFKGTP